MTTPQRPADYTEGLGELIRAHRVYVGLSQRSMAARLGKDRRDYQRIENGRDACPPGLLGTVEAMSDEFDTTVEAVIGGAEASADGLEIMVDPDPRWEWERNIAGRAAMLTSTDPTAPDIVLRMVPAPGHNPSQVG